MGKKEDIKQFTKELESLNHSRRIFQAFGVVESMKSIDWFMKLQMNE